MVGVTTSVVSSIRERSAKWTQCYLTALWVADSVARGRRGALSFFGLKVDLVCLHKTCDEEPLVYLKAALTLLTGDSCVVLQAALSKSIEWQLYTLLLSAPFSRVMPDPVLEQLPGTESEQSYYIPVNHIPEASHSTDSDAQNVRAMTNIARRSELSCIRY